MLLLSLASAGCQTTAPPAGSRLAWRKRCSDWTWARFTAREAQRQEYMTQGTGIMEGYLRGDPQRAHSTLRHILETD